MTPATLEAIGQLDIDFPPATQSLSIEYFPREIIEPDPEQPRQDADAELRASIARNGILQPITVREIANGRYRIVDGERRWRGSEGILDRIPCVVREDQEDRAMRLQTQLVANTGKPLSALEEARAFRELLTRYESVTALAQALGRPLSTVAERLQLLELGPWLAWLESGRITVSHAVRALLAYRGCSDEAHEKAMAVVEKDYRVSRNDDDEGPISVSDFDRVVEQAFRPHLYPLTKTKTSFDKQPEFDTKRHDDECDCGGIHVASGYAERKRKYCGNPSWWRPLHRKALAAKPKPKASSNGHRQRVTWHLPAGTPTVDLPKGLISLTDENGKWNTAQRGSDGGRFDPSTVSIDPAKLVLIQWTYGVPRVGTKDFAAIEKARETWRARWDARRAQLMAPIRKAFAEQRAAYRVSGPGLTEIVGQLSLYGQQGEGYRDAVELAGLTLPDKVARAEAGWKVREALEKWAGALEEKEAAALLTAIAWLSGTRTKAPTLKLEEEIEAEARKIQKKAIPWAKAPAGETKGKGAKAKTAPVDDDEDLVDDEDWDDAEEE